MILTVIVSLTLLWSLVESNSQTFPYVSFMGQTLANHSYVDLSLVGVPRNGGDSVQCHTDLTTCCTGSQGIHRGDWYFPNGDRLQFDSNYNDIHQNRSKGELTYVAKVQPHQLECITVTLQQLMSMIMKPLS